jgi:hypothetical protein
LKAAATLCTAAVVLAGWAAPPGYAEEDGPETRVFDASLPLKEGINLELLNQRPGWKTIPEDILPEAFAGAAVVLNDKLALVLQKEHLAELYSRATGQRQASIGYVAEAARTAEPIEAVRCLENTAGGARMEVRFQAGHVLRFRLTTGEALVEMQSPAGTGWVEAQSATRFVVAPDYFGDDLVYGQGRAGLLPAENFCLHLLEGGNAMLMTVWQSPEQDAVLAWRGGTNAVSAAERIRCLPEQSTWLALLEGPGIWHERAGFEAGGWTPPFPAKWRASFVRTGVIADSWAAEDGPSSAQKAGSHQGPLLIYPLDRSIATPLTATCPTDVMRNTLGVGPCQYILACEGMAAQGDPTPNSVMGWVEKQFEQKKQRKAADDIRERLEQMTAHVAEARTRIQAYAELAAQIRQQISAPALRDATKDALADLDRAAAAGLSAEAGPERAKQLASEVAGLIGQDNASPACRRAGQELRSLGAVQDGALARCRMSVRRLRQEARVLGEQPALAAEASEVRRLAEAKLRR